MWRVFGALRTLQASLVIFCLPVLRSIIYAHIKYQNCERWESSACSSDLHHSSDRRNLPRSQPGGEMQTTVKEEKPSCLCLESTAYLTKYFAGENVKQKRSFSPSNIRASLQTVFYTLLLAEMISQQNAIIQSTVYCATHTMCFNCLAVADSTTKKSGIV